MRRQINKADRTETGRSVSHPPSQARDFSEQSDPPSNRRQVEPAPQGAQRFLAATRSVKRVDRDPPGPSRPERTRPLEGARGRGNPRRACSRARAHAGRGGAPSRHPVSARPRSPAPARAPPPRPGCGEQATGSHFKAELEVTGEQAGSGAPSPLPALAAAEWLGRRSPRPQPATLRNPSLPSAPTPVRTLSAKSVAPQLGSRGRRSQGAG